MSLRPLVFLISGIALTLPQLELLVLPDYTFSPSFGMGGGDGRSAVGAAVGAGDGGRGATGMPGSICSACFLEANLAPRLGCTCTGLTSLLYNWPITDTARSIHGDSYGDSYHIVFISASCHLPSASPHLAHVHRIATQRQACTIHTTHNLQNITHHSTQYTAQCTSHMHPCILLTP